jgi:hypothetical protein
MVAREVNAIADVRWSIGCNETYDWFPGDVEAVAGIRFLHVAVSFSFGHFSEGSLKSVKGQPRTLRHRLVASEIFCRSPLGLRRLSSD